jgi:hypothetical protein
MFFPCIQSIAEIYPYRGGTDELKIFAEINFLVLRRFVKNVE